MKADLVILNGNILTLSEQGKAEALAILKDRIVFIGSNEDVKEYIGKSTKVIDVFGKCVIPGFCDSHAHFLSLGADHIDLSETKSIEDVTRLLEKKSRDIPKEDWLIGVNWDESKWDDGRYITKYDLDEIENPVFLRRIDGHLASLNSKGLAKLKIEEKFLKKDERGEKTGIIIEDAVFQTYNEIARGKKELEKSLRKAQKIALQNGVTSVHDVGDDRSLKTYLSLRRELRVRIYLNLLVEFFENLERLGIVTGFGNEVLRLGGVKIFLDGSLGAHTASLKRPYSDDEKTCGMMLYDEEELEILMRRIDKAGLQLMVHAIGDKAIEKVIEIFEKFLIKGKRHRIEHLEITPNQLVKRLKKLKIIASMQPNFVGNWSKKGGMYEARLGKDRLKVNNRFRTLADSEIKIAFGSDCMPFNPLYGIHFAVNHPIKEERITVLEALKFYTVNGAFASFEEDIKGTIEVGKLADLCVLSRDPTKNPKKIKDIKVEMTIFSGEVVYERANPFKIRL
ncbi:MAG: amidohydrolase [Candidatus Methanofastidiosia archaeon]